MLMNNDLLLFVVVALFPSIRTQDDYQLICWKKPKPPVASECPDWFDYDCLLCYQNCQVGYTGIGPVCWGSCGLLGSGYVDVGALCHHDMTVISADISACPWYDICGLIFNQRCSKCPDGFINDGCTCRGQDFTKPKPSYGRGIGIAPSLLRNRGLDFTKCPDGTKKDYNNNVCWPKCPNLMRSTGGVCFSGGVKVDLNVHRAGKAVAEKATQNNYDGAAIQRVVSSILGYQVPQC